ncbi:L-ascorbate metabolism protein UlaG (beta-lactamase superfamily) [Dysgonomonas alginatilytica]|uniref:L-ascorbate metabolism protein UlaG (Beta-lactamase superfamily) n=1 Tax=Dysgonomonas alginatilytica TaxID=1605892 RepID=A0A2V3PLT9_9BACT|nr:MBL fold metallo-hydrolase [Dysgonomonas alginatilytica]PXV62688.1 L-ascorbate metabolism protein UlaG (beta-lactamase superfamily) [Dysgonomonas alginatilytica]
MRLTYIYHSGFAIEAANFTIIIDYYQDSINKNHGVVTDRLLHRPQKLYVLVSHGHADHFNPEILKWREERQDITYIFSKDIETAAKTAFCDIIFIDKDEQYKDDILQIDAFGSTDLGISFKIKADNKVIFHAGDLNNWHWNEESTDEEIKEAEEFYSRELDHLASSTPAIDIAMFPVDPRLGKDYMKGADQFLEKIPTKLVIPMHFDTAYDKAAEIKNIAEKYNTEVFVPSHRGDTIEI